MKLRRPQEPGTEEVGVLRGGASSSRACPGVGRTLGPLTPARSPKVYAASARLSIQEEQGAPGRPGRNYEFQEALRRRAFTTGH